MTAPLTVREAALRSLLAQPGDWLCPSCTTPGWHVLIRREASCPRCGAHKPKCCDLAADGSLRGDAKWCGDVWPDDKAAWCPWCQQNGAPTALAAGGGR